MSIKDTTLAVLPDVPDLRFDTRFPQVATIVTLGGDGSPLVHVRGADAVVTARLALPVTRERMDRAVAQQQPAVVVFENGDPQRPLIIGFIEPAAPASAQEPSTIDTTPAAPLAAPDAAVVEADVDGRRVRVIARDEIVLQCGAASITLRRNGRVIVRGTYVETHSEGTNRIKGGQVQIN